MNRPWFHHFDVETRLRRWGLWALRNGGPMLGYPYSVLAKLYKAPNYESTFNAAPQVGDDEAMEIERIVLTLDRSSITVLRHHYLLQWVERRERFRRCGMSKSNYYRTLGEAKKNIENILTSWDFGTNFDANSDRLHSHN